MQGKGLDPASPFKPGPRQHAARTRELMRSLAQSQQGVSSGLFFADSPPLAAPLCAHRALPEVAQWGKLNRASQLQGY